MTSENGDESLPHATVRWRPTRRARASPSSAVLAANDARLRTCALRPHSVFGPGDTRLVPAILARRERGSSSSPSASRQAHRLHLRGQRGDACLLASIAWSPTQLAVRHTSSPTASRWASGTSSAASWRRSIFRRSAAMHPTGWPTASPASPRRSPACAASPSARRTGCPASPCATCARTTIQHRQGRTRFGYTPRIDLAEGIRRTCAALG